MNFIKNLFQFIYDWPSLAVVIAVTVAIARKQAHGILSRKFCTILFFLLPAVILVACIPLLIILLASNGSINILNLRWVGGWADRGALMLDLLIPFFLVFLPQLIRRKLTWERAATNVQALLPTWLAVLAAAATTGLIFSLHFFKGGQLGQLGPGALTAAGIGIVLLLTPFYSLLARACWQRSYKEVFNPKQWGYEQKHALLLVWCALRKPISAEPGQAEGYVNGEPAAGRGQGGAHADGEPQTTPSRTATASITER